MLQRINPELTQCMQVFFSVSPSQCACKCRREIFDLYQYWYDLNLKVTFHMPKIGELDCLGQSGCGLVGATTLQQPKQLHCHCSSVPAQGQAGPRL